MSIENKKEQFFQDYRDMFEMGILREVYSGKKLNIYAIAERTYAAVPFDIDLPDKEYVFITLYRAEIKEILKNEDFFVLTFQNRMQENEVGIIRPELKPKMIELNEERLQNKAIEIKPEEEAELFGKLASLE